jgi:hypothetical protein
VLLPFSDGLQELPPELIHTHEQLIRLHLWG